MKKLRNVGLWLWKYSRVILTIILIVLSVHIIRSNNDFRESLKFNVYQESFDLGMIPTGIVIWSHGVPGSEMAFIHADTSMRYKYFDIGILSQHQVVHKVRLPYFVMATIRIGFPVDFRKEIKKKEPKQKPKPEFYVYPERNSKQKEKNI